MGYASQSTTDPRLALDRQIGLGHATADSEHAIARENGATGEQAAALPVGKPQLRFVQRVLAVDPTGNAIAHERRIHRVVKTLLHGGIFTDQRHGELRTVAVEQRNRLIQIGIAIGQLFFQLLYFFRKQVALPLLSYYHKTDLVFSPDILSPVWARGKKISVLHDTFFWDNPDHYQGLWLKYYLYFLQKGLRKNGEIITITQFSKIRLQELFEFKSIECLSWRYWRFSTFSN